jgi:hypothetical protein
VKCSRANSRGKIADVLNHGEDAIEWDGISLGCDLFIGLLLGNLFLIGSNSIHINRMA